ncbi:receptor-type tyrosine-protein phosphatase H-like [Rhipicephalus sanguineus]|uniref:receptor-type tyrosine-protein phosphatase H-like n=1 Tax=Rhipicephalus sanguineus TaxID=34632 RepID=UPI0020C48F60|nr:receptor-type tyrosine-protein phosphatase H-like [Rhipicephalus sanguineus]
MGTYTRIQLIVILALFGKEQQALCRETYVKEGDAVLGSQYAPPSFTAEVPLMDSAVVSALTSSALRITWTTEWKYQLRITVCPLEGTKRHCNDYVADGSEYVYTVTGLSASTLYEVDTTAQVTRYGLTCTGPVFEQDVTTFSSDIGPVRDLIHTVINVTVISASWDEPAEADRIDGYTIICKNEASGQSTTAELLRTGNVSIVLDVKQQLANFNCSVNAFATWESGRQEGLARVFEEATDGIAAPREVNLTNSTKTSLTYSWLADPTAKKFRIHVRAVSPNCSTLDLIRWLDTEAHVAFVENTVLHLSPGTLYEVSIQNCADYCGLSTVVRSTTEIDAPSPVRELQSNLTGFSDVTLTWERPQMPNGPIDGFVVKLVNENVNRSDVHTVDGRNLSLSVHLRDHFTYFKASVSAYNVDYNHNLTLYGIEEETDFATLGKGKLRW